MSREGLYERRKGRASYSPHIRLYAFMLPAMMERLSGNSIKLLLYLMSFENGRNNGDLFMSARKACDGTGLSKKTVLNCFEQLDRAGFIRPVEVGYFNVKGRPATRWRLTFIHAFGKAATNEWREPVAERKSWGEKVPDMGREITPLIASSPKSGVKTAPGSAIKAGKIDHESGVENPS